MSAADARLDRAKHYLAIAESGDARREAYRQATEEIVAAKQEDPALTNVQVATFMGRSHTYVDKLLRWRATGYDAATPFLADEQATTRAANSHARKVLRERPEVLAQELAQQPVDVQAAFAEQVVKHAPEAVGRALGRADAQVNHDVQRAAGLERHYPGMQGEELSRARATDDRSREAADTALSGVTSAAATLSVPEAINHLRASRDRIAYLVQHDAAISRGQVGVIERLLGEVRVELEVYASRHGFALDEEVVA